MKHLKLVLPIAAALLLTIFTSAAQDQAPQTPDAQVLTSHTSATQCPATAQTPTSQASATQCPATAQTPTNQASATQCLVATQTPTNQTSATQCPTAQTPTSQTPETQRLPLSTHYPAEQLAEMTAAYYRSHSQDVAPPVELRDKLRRDFPLATDVEWETANGLYEASFEIRSRDVKALYDPAGRLLQTTEEIRRSALPPTIRKAAAAKYPTYRMEDPCRIRRGAETLYKVEMQRPGSDDEVKLILSADGAILKEFFDY